MVIRLGGWIGWLLGLGGGFFRLELTLGKISVYDRGSEYLSD